MTSFSRTTAAIAIAALASASFLHAVDIWTVGVNNTRQGWNRFETMLTPANVPRLRKIREFAVDEKIDVSPLIVGDRLYVFTMTNTAYVFDVNTGAQVVAPRQLAAALRPAARSGPDGPLAHLSQLGDHRDAGDRRRHQHALRHDVRQAGRQQPEQRAQQHAVDTRRQHARRQETAGADRRRRRQWRRRASPMASRRRIRRCAPASGS